MPKHRVPLNIEGRTMSSLNTISVDKLARLIGTPKCPALIDVRTDEDFAADPRLIPGSLRRPLRDVARNGPPRFAGRSAVVDLPAGAEAQPGRRRLAAPRRRRRRVLWKAASRAGAQAGLPLVPTTKLPPRDAAAAPSG